MRYPGRPSPPHGGFLIQECKISPFIAFVFSVTTGLQCNLYLDGRHEVWRISTDLELTPRVYGYRLGISRSHGVLVCR